MAPRHLRSLPQLNLPALWIAPIALFFAYIYRGRIGEDKAKIAIPWFILLFLLATAFRTYAPSFIFPSIFDALVNLAKAGLTLTLFFIGASLSQTTLREVGYLALLEGVILWIAISVVGLFAVWNLV